MQKNSLFKLLIVAAAFSVAVLWFVSMFIEPLESWFNIYWGIAILSGLCGIIFIFKGFKGKNDNVLKRTDMAIGAALIVSAILAGAKNFMDGGRYALPMIAVVVTAVMLLSVVLVKGKPWDAGDNQTPDYKDYHTRKAEEEQKKQDENSGNKS